MAATKNTNSTAKKKGTAGKSTSASKTSASSAGKKKTLRASSAGKSRSTASSKKAAPAPKDSLSGIGLDVAFVVLLVAAVLIFISNLGYGGAAGALISRFSFGTMGVVAYVFPLLLLAGFMFYGLIRRTRFAGRKMLGLLLTFIFVCAFAEILFSRESIVAVNPMTVYENSAAGHKGGGLLGGTVTFLFSSVFGYIGTLVLTSFGFIISLIIMTQKPLFTVLGRKGRDEAIRLRERRQIRREKKEEEIRREEEHREMIRREERRAAAENEKKRAALSEQEIKVTTDYRERGLTDVEIPASVKKVDSKEKKNADRSAYSAMPSFLKKHADGEPPLKKDTIKSGSIESESEVHAEVERTREKILSPEFKVEYVENFTVQEPVKEKKPDAMPIKAETAAAEMKTAVPEKMPVPAEKPVPKTAEKSGGKEKVTGEEAKQAAAEVAKTISGEQALPAYRLPDVGLLNPGSTQTADSRAHLLDTAQKLEQLFADFNVNVHVVNVSQGPTVTRYELQPEQGVKVSRIISLADDIKLNLATADIRIEAPIPGKAAVGIEVPNKEVSAVNFRDLMECREFKAAKGNLTFAVGKDIGGRPVIADIEKMPHLLIAGATGSGKSVCINTLIMSVLYKSTPEEVRMLMIDPKVVELKIYDGIPHLLIPVVTDPKKAAGALNWAVQEMTERYKKFAEMNGVRDLKSYNERIARINEALPEEEKQKPMPKILVIVDELADLMMVAQHEVEDAICRLAQLARAAGIHLVIATQRPSVNVVTGLIKANMPSRIALAVSSGVDSRTIIDMNGAEKLLGKGDMLFYPQGYPKPARVQGAYISDNEITKVVKFVSSQKDQAEYNTVVEDQITENINFSDRTESGTGDGQDEYFVEAGRLVIEKEKATIGMLQRAFRIGFNRAARIVDALAEAGVIGPEEGTKPRKVLMSLEEFESFISQQSKG